MANEVAAGCSLADIREIIGVVRSRSADVHPISAIMNTLNERGKLTPEVLSIIQRAPAGEIEKSVDQAMLGELPPAVEKELARKILGGTIQTKKTDLPINIDFRKPQEKT